MSGESRDDASVRLARLEREMVRCIGGDFDARLTVSERSDDLDAIATGINILLDEVQFAIAERARRKAIEDALQKQALLFEAIQDAVIVVDPQNQIVAWNPAASSSFGLTASEVLGGPPFPMLSVDKAEALEAEIIASLARDGAWHDELELPDEADDVRTYQATIVPVSGVDNEVVGRVQIFRDISESRRLEQQVQHAERLKSLGVLAGGVAHDFNNQLAGIQTAAEVLRKMLSEESPSLGAYVDHILLASRRAADLTEQLLAFARRGPMRREPVNVNALVGEVSELVSRGVGKQITVVLELHEGPLTVLGDSSQLQNVLLNIAFNARDAMLQGGTLSIKTELLAASTHHALGVPGEGGERVRLSLRDTGVGMSEAVVRRIFEPFFTTKPQGQGVGMGLSTVFGVVESHGGFIDVESEVGKGTCVQIELPYAASVSTPAPRHDASASLDEVGGGAHIVVVDDEAMILSLVQEALELEGYRVLGFERGQRALDYFRAHADEVDAVVLDLMMPGLSGAEVLSRLREIDPHVAVVLCSGFSEEIELWMNSGILRFIQKPYPLTELTSAITEVIRLRSGQSATLRACS